MGSTVAAESSGTHHGLRLAQRYQLLERLTDGALASVYRGQDLALRRLVLAKAVPPEHVASYRASLEKTSTLGHPAVVCVYDAVEHDDWLFLIQEYVTGRPLTAYLRQGVPTERAVDLCIQIARAISHAHMHGVVHGDLTPTAVLVDRNAVARINNFGLPPDTTYFASAASGAAACLHSDSRTEALPALGPRGGTGYLRDASGGTPETSPASVAADTRAIGYLLWLLLTDPVAGAIAAEAGGEVRQFRGEVGDGLRRLVRRAVDQTGPSGLLEAHELTLELEEIAGDLARGRPARSFATPPSVLAARAAAQQSASWSTEQTIETSRQAWSGAAHPADRTVPEGTRVLTGDASAHSAADSGAHPVPRAGLSSRPVAEMPSDGAAPHWSFPGAEAYDIRPERNGFPLVGVLLLGSVLFVLFFLVGYFSALWK
jgi:hypothetical protein